MKYKKQVGNDGEMVWTICADCHVLFVGNWYIHMGNAREIYDTVAPSHLTPFSKGVIAQAMGG
jgi:hypothetical protein